MPGITPPAGTLADVEVADPHRVERSATVVMILAAPFFVAGVLFAISVVGVIFAVPLLLVSTPVILAAGRARRQPDDPDLVRRFGVAAFALAAVLTGGLLAAVIAWRDDVAPWLGIVGLTIGLILVVAAWWAVRHLGPDALQQPSS